MSSPPRSAEEIRESFLRFFAERGHRIVPSAAVIPDSDPTLLFTNSGMVPFKRVFTGEEIRPYKRAVSSQKCMRVSGKHNDLENVGRTPRHHTFFEMLGNFSFGDYFKREAIEYAWELVTKVWEMPEERLVVSVFRDDSEAYEIWNQKIGLEPERIFRLDEDENFWSMGETGPCGPCSEIHVDYGARSDCTNPSCDPSCECGRYLEFWNLVFMQYDRDTAGNLTPLPSPCVDTGAGLERVSALIQGVDSVYATDLFTPLLERIQEISGTRFGEDSERDDSLRIVADHARAVTILLSDGVLPSNEGRGYVLRRILRRAARHGVLLGLERPFLHEVAGTVIDELRQAFPELEERRSFITDRIRREEERFSETLSKGLVLLENEAERVANSGGDLVSGSVVFQLYDTYGFPVDLTDDILRRRNLRYDQAGFESAMNEQRARGRAAWKGSGDEGVGEVYGRIAADLSSEFLGYDTLDISSGVRALLVEGSPADVAEAGAQVEVMVEETPFYPESGGQVGDRGVLFTESGRVRVEDTQKPLPGLIVHRGVVEEGEIRVEQAADLRVNPSHRAGVVRHHTGTHLLHAALREVLGPQAVQRGSLVAPERLRFDFTNDTPVTLEQIERIEDRVNGWIEENAPARIEEMPYRDAIDEGAVAMFGEKYGDQVRVVAYGDFSMELCGGTHVVASGEIGLLKIVSEGGVASGVRRVEALTGPEALARWRSQERTLGKAAELLRAPPSELADRVEKLLEERRNLERELEKLRTQQRRIASEDLVAEARELSGVRVLSTEVTGVGGKELRSLVDDLRNKLGSGVVLVCSVDEGKLALALGVTSDLTSRFKAGEMMKSLCSTIGGRGGGRADFAQGGASDPASAGPAIEAFDALFENGTGLGDQTGSGA